MKQASNCIVNIREALEDDASSIKKIVNSVASEKYYVVPERSREDWDQAIREIKKRKGIAVISIQRYSVSIILVCNFFNGICFCSDY